MMQNVTEEEKSRSYFYICIVVGVGTIMILCALLVKFSFDEHIAKYHTAQNIVHPKPSMEREKNQEMEVKEMSEEQIEIDTLFDEGDALEMEDASIEEIENDVQVDDIAL